MGRLWLTTINMKRQASCGSWKSPLTADVVVAGALKLSDIRMDGGNIYWLESRPAEGGRSVIVRRREDGQCLDVTPPPFNARTRAHEYGGASFSVAGNLVCFANYSDQCLYLERGLPEPLALTAPSGCRYADGIFDLPRSRTIWVQENHDASNEPSNSIVSVGLAGDHPPQVLVSGRDFYACPRLSADGSRLAWLSWNHPDMPWDATELWVADIRDDGWPGDSRPVAGQAHESICQPEWSPDGTLYFASDRGGCWNLHRFIRDTVETVVENNAEFARPPWVFGLSAYDFRSARQIVCSFAESGRWHLGRINCASRELEPITCPYTDISYLRAGQRSTVFRGGSPSEPASIVDFDHEFNSFTVLRASAEAGIDRGYLSIPEVIEFPTSAGNTAYANFYRPTNCDFAAGPGELPPLLVKVHGGPTSCADTTLRLDIQFWTSRGFAVADVNYGGSSGFGTSYRRRLEGKWGVVDVDDCTNAALYLVDRAEVDPERLAISGGSAGGYTVLCALAFKNVFKAGASYYGIADLVALAKTTHKFESRYTDRLVGPYPEALELYKRRSPLYFADQITQPVIFFQGLEDKVVPPEQTESMVEALKERSIPVAYLPFAGEGHGFRTGTTIKRALEAELYFYSRVFGFELSNFVPGVAIENL